MRMLPLLLSALVLAGCTFNVKESNIVFGRAVPVPDIALGFDASCRSAAIAYAKQQRKRGVSVAMMYGMSAASIRARVDAHQALSAVFITPEGLQQYGKAVF